MRMLYERRHQRSRDPITALGYQLASIRESGELEALVVADDFGLVLASSGDGTLCAELGAYAPLLRRTVFATPLPPLLQGGAVEVRPVTLNGQELYMASVGGGHERASWIERGLAGVQRILTLN